MVSRTTDKLIDINCMDKDVQTNRSNVKKHGVEMIEVADVGNKKSENNSNV